MNSSALDPRARAVYREAMALLDAAGLPFLVGGAYALERYTGIVRHTKDFDVFVHPRDVDRVLDAFRAAGWITETAFPHWLAKARNGEDFVDVIWSSGNGIAAVDDEWFEHAVEEAVLDRQARLSPPEEMIWSKAFIMERERYDGADVAHIIRASAERLDWPRLVARFDAHWRVLLMHLIVFGFIYPCDRHRVPVGVMRELMRRLEGELVSPASERVCQGTLVSRAQYLVDVAQWGYVDPRVAPRGNMTERETALWTAGIAEDGPRSLPPLTDDHHAA